MGETSTALAPAVVDWFCDNGSHRTGSRSAAGSAAPIGVAGNSISCMATARDRLTAAADHSPNMLRDRYTFTMWEILSNASAADSGLSTPGISAVLSLSATVARYLADTSAA